MGENICKWSNWQEINLQNMQTAYVPLSLYVYINPNDPIKKWVSKQLQHTMYRIGNWEPM